MLELAQIFQSNMVLQRDKAIKIWGKADADVIVNITIQGKQTETMADGNGNFSVEIDPLTTSVEESMVVTSGQSELKLDHIAVGEVWIAGGQSNMEFYMEFEKHIEEEREQCNNAQVRFYDVPKIAFEGQGEAFDYSKMGIWRTSTRKNIGYYSAVGYFFEKELNLALDVPVGIVGCNWGGTRAASWMNTETVKKVGKLWIAEYEKASAGVDMCKFFEEQKHLPINDCGSQIDNPFYKFMMPKTHTQEEIIDFLQQFGGNKEDVNNPLCPQNIPGGLYKYMLQTIAGFANRGVIWYQGESDDDIEGGQKIYGKMLGALIQDWRELWGDELPFLIVQLPGWERWLDNVNNDYRTIRKEQERVTEQIANTYLCSIGDVGEQFDIHPKDKKTVGTRLAKLALGHIYGKRIMCDAPRLFEGKRQGNSIVLTFNYTGAGLKIKGNKINALDITANGNVIDSEVSISYNKIIVQFNKIPNDPVKISFAQNAWYQINLYNSAGIPAIPFEIRI